MVNKIKDFFIELETKILNYVDKTGDHDNYCEPPVAEQ